MDKGTPFLELADLFEALEGTTKRNKKKRLIGDFLRSLREDEIQPAVTFIVGKAFPEADPRVLEVGGQTLWKIVEDGKQTTLVQRPLTLLEVERYFENIAAARGKGSRGKKESLVQGLMHQASPLEARYIIRILLGEMRIGAVEGVMLEAISEASSTDLDLVRRGNMLLGNLGEVARIALKHGAEGLGRIEIRLFTPIKPMLAEMSYDLGEVIFQHGGETAFDYKFDGARIQIHKRRREVKIYSRRLTDVTESVPEIVELARRTVRADEALVDGEAVAYGGEGKPLPFQDLMRRFRRVHNIDEMVKKIPLKLYLFDILHLNNRTLIDLSYEERWKLLSQTCDSSILAPRIVTGDRKTAEEFLESAMKAGHEGLMAKSLSSDYTPGIRGKKWFKIKPFDTLDLVIVAADWGYGRREGWLSNYHLAARDKHTGEFMELGKTFKGLTDDEFTEMTRQLQALKTSEDRYTVYVKPDIVVEVAYNEIQHSPHYKSGFALRFARITRIRTDKEATEADTINRVREHYERQFATKAKIDAS